MNSNNTAHAGNTAPTTTASTASTTSTATVADVIAVMEQAYPPELAESWDKVGLICGDPDAPVRRVGFALDCTNAVAQAAVDADIDMLITHHPLLLRGVHSVATNTPKGATVTTLIKGDVALFAAHTNADSARPGVSDQLAEILGITPGQPISPNKNNPELGLGRIGTLDTPMPLAEFVQRVADRLPTTEWGVRAAGDPDATITTVAVASGAGDSFLDTIIELSDTTPIDAYLTSDLRHHPVDEYLRAGGPSIIDTAHWASESPWLTQAQQLIHDTLGLECHMIDIRTDPWNLAAKQATK
ncbi:hypothetical protein CARG_06965 [Corynebacterium argentoratense DSM 44202]|uniref:GTP cyclohydrolase 1 type 2 homolog n=1 Tax=Corynebacterium argentoratense DSM 44202 TaxID=1348662 RepID=U3GZQ2_9CORY|nr:Nif3-like dinuclear metal center hexameric protein [Corynebacterium argentoratense]AGU15517.1 hypothetical protein CARG_06965 [Corynebacterium argentoratense DSM 44202]